MNMFRPLFTTLVGLLLGAVLAYGQLTDQQVINEVRRLQATGASQEKIISELVARGVTRQQAERLRALYEAGELEDLDSKEEAFKATDSRLREVFSWSDAVWDEVYDTEEHEKSNIYGKDLFSIRSLTFQPSLNLPTPENYQLGAGDEIIIDIWGNSELSVRQTISPDGTINVPNVGPIHLNGMEIKEASAKIKTAFSRIYSDLRAARPGTFIKTSVGNIRSIRVNVMGEVERPGTYTMSSFASVFHALYAAGGINDIGSLRDVKLYRNGKLYSQIDVYKYLLQGDNSGDIILKENDVVKVEPYSIQVHIEGQVKRPMIYQMLEGEKLDKVLAYAGGFTGDAYKKNVQLTRMGATQRRVFTVEAEYYAGFELQDGDSIQVGTILDRYDNRVEIAGAVFRPGFYAIDERLQTVLDLISMAEGPTEDAFLGRAILRRENPDLSHSIESLDLAKMLAKEISDIPLQRNDRLYIMSEDSLRQDFTITIRGEIRNPGDYPFAENVSIEDLIVNAGGLLESASLVKVDVARRTRNPLATEASAKLSETYTFSMENGLIISGDKDFVLQPYDIVIVRRSPEYNEQASVTLSGEVVFPGSYTKKERNERISSLVARAGGVTPGAYLKGATLMRQMDERERNMAEYTLRLSMQMQAARDSIVVDSIDIARQRYYVGIDLEKILERPGRAGDLVLKEGDVLNVPEMNNVVRISGGVLYPNVVAYREGMTLRDYIDNAGGFAERARRSKVYVVYMNNTVSKGTASTIEPGCEIIVPFKPEKSRVLWSDVVQVSSSVLSMISLTVMILLNISRIK